MRRMKKAVLLLTLAISFCVGASAPEAAAAGGQKNSAGEWPAGPGLASEGGIIIEEDTGAVLYGKNIHKRFYPASTTKIMTALLALENCGLDETVTFSHDAVYTIEPGSSIIGGVDAGDKMSMRDCLYGLMLSSGNEAAYAIAEHVGGTMHDFVDMMNKKAKELGLKDTHFTNPHGLHDKNHYTSPYDLAMIMREAWKDADFRMITGTVKYTIPADKYCKKDRVLYNHNKMLPGRLYGYDGVLGGKTGYTAAAGNTLAEAAAKNGMTCFTVVMKAAKPCHYTDTKALLDFAFSSFQKANISETESEERLEELMPELREKGASCIIDGDACVVLPKGWTIADAGAELDADGYLAYQYNGRNIGGVHVSLVLPDEEEEAKKREERPEAASGRRGRSALLLFGLAVLMAACYYAAETGKMDKWIGDLNGFLHKLCNFARLHK